jgi:hypothetical protein
MALTRTSAWREAGRLACRQVETNVSAEGKACKERCTKRKLCEVVLSVRLLIYPGATLRNGIREAASDRAPLSERKARLLRARSKRGPDGAAAQRHQYRLESSPEHGRNREPHCHTRGKQREHTPAQPHYCRPQMRRRAERDPESAANSEIRGNAHRALWHQSERDAGQCESCRAACSRFGPLLRPGMARGWARGGFPGKRSRTPPARANEMRHCVLRNHHALASLWQHAEAFGALSY